jgi:hypothetical protein
MTPRLTFAAVLTLFLPAIAAAQRPAPKALRQLRAEPNACVTVNTTCGAAPVQGELGPSDCTFSDGTYYDSIAFPASAGTLLEATIDRFSPTLTQPFVFFVPPSGDASSPPAVEGGSKQLLRYVAASTGTWHLVVNTNTITDQGSYRVSLACGANPNPSDPQSCIDQRFLSPVQGFEWSLGPASCRFTGGSAGVYQEFVYHAFRGDTLRVTVQSFRFTPLLGIIDETSEDYLVEAGGNGNTATATWQAEHDGDYFFVVNGFDANSAGDFTIDLNATVTCLAPQIVSLTSSQTIPAGSNIQLTANASGTAPLTYSWTTTADPTTTIALGPTVTLRPSRTTTYVVRAENRCGTTTSDPVTITVTPVKRRIAR